MTEETPKYIIIATNDNIEITIGMLYDAVIELRKAREDTSDLLNFLLIEYISDTLKQLTDIKSKLKNIENLL